MMRAIAIKELRETIGIAAIALAVYAIAVSLVMGVNFIFFDRLLPGAGGGVPFADGAFNYSFGLISYALAIALGFRQSAWEGMRGTYLFLLHRPSNHAMIFAAKLLTGVAIMEVTAALPVLLFSAWAALPGTHASPFEWSMTESAWGLWLGLPIVYLGAFLSGLRPGRWRGTRLLPLAGATCLFAALVGWSLWVTFGFGLLVSLGLVGLITYVAAERDFG